jgi:hypothetical protein
MNCFIKQVLISQASKHYDKANVNSMLMEVDKGFFLILQSFKKFCFHISTALVVVSLAG